LLDTCFTCVMFLFVLLHDLNLEIGLPLFSFWFKKSCNPGCFHVHDNFNKLPSCLFFIFLLLLSFNFKNMSTFVKEILVVLRNFE